MTSTDSRSRGFGLNNPFRPLRHRNFALLWSGELVRTSAQWMDQITRAFLVLSLTDSNAHLALVTAVRGVPLLILGLASGVLADRISRKRLLMSSQGMNIAANIILAVLVATGNVELWHVYVTAIIIGVGMALNAPARQSALPSLVPPEDLQHAVVLNTATLNIGQAVGPAIGGFLVGGVGLSWVFAVQAGMFLMAGELIRRIHLPHLPREGPTVRWRTSMGDGVRYLRSHPLLPSLFVMSLVPLVFVQPFRGVVPAIATQDLGLTASQTGTLLASVGAGAIISVITLASLPPIRRPGPVIVVSTVGFCCTTLVFALSPVYWMALAAIFLGGVLQATMRTLSQSVLLSETEDEYRGRMSSVYVVNRGMMPLGATVLGALTPALGVATAVAAMSAAGAAVASWIGLRSKALWRH